MDRRRYSPPPSIRRRQEYGVAGRYVPSQDTHYSSLDERFAAAQGDRRRSYEGNEKPSPYEDCRWDDFARHERGRLPPPPGRYRPMPRDYGDYHMSGGASSSSYSQHSTHPPPLPMQQRRDHQDYHRRTPEDRRERYAVEIPPRSAGMLEPGHSSTSYRSRFQHPREPSGREEYYAARRRDYVVPTRECSSMDRGVQHDSSNSGKEHGHESASGWDRSVGREHDHYVSEHRHTEGRYPRSSVVPPDAESPRLEMRRSSEFMRSSVPVPKPASANASPSTEGRVFIPPPLRSEWAKVPAREVEKLYEEQRRALKDEASAGLARRKAEFDYFICTWEVEKIDHLLDILNEQKQY